MFFPPRSFLDAVNNVLLETPAWRVMKEALCSAGNGSNPFLSRGLTQCNRYRDAIKRDTHSFPLTKHTFFPFSVLNKLLVCEWMCRDVGLLLQVQVQYSSHLMQGDLMFQAAYFVHCSAVILFTEDLESITKW